MHFSVFLGLRVGMRINCKWVQEIWGREIDAKCSKTRLHNPVAQPCKFTFLNFIYLWLCWFFVAVWACLWLQ